MSKRLIKGIHFYLNDLGLMVFTEKYHKERGYCCKSGCLHCPYGFNKEASNKLSNKKTTSGNN